MPWLDATHLPAALACGVACAALAWRSPALIARLPEPTVEQTDTESDPAEPVADGGGRAAAPTIAPAPPKEPYADIAALPHLGSWLAVAAGMVGVSFGLALGWTGALLFLVPLVPIGVVLLLIDWRTTLLPTRILHPTYVLMAVLVPLAALVDRDLEALYRAGWGWLVIGGWFWSLWWLLNAWGFGDVRLSRVLGPALGYLGWPHILVGLALMVLVGGIGGVVLGLANRSLRRRFPYGPFMLVGAALAVVAAPELARGLGY